MTKLHRYRGLRAFTIVEVLVVVAVLSVLMAILLPSLAKARVLARRIACQGHLRQIALAYTAYLHANDGRFYGEDPNAKNANYTFGGWRGKRMRVAYRPVNAYLSLPVQNAREDDAGVFRCPEDRNQDPNFTIYGSSYTDQGNSYQANLLLVAPHLLPVDRGEPWNTINARIRVCRPVRLDGVFQPSRVLWMGDYTWYAQWDPLNSVCTGPHRRRHHQPMAFLDGHVAFVEIVRGMYDVDGSYRIQPHRAADETVRELQHCVPCSCEREKTGN